MLNTGKIRAMTALEIFRKENKTDIETVEDYYRYDYVMSQGFVSFLRFTFCFALLFVIYVLFNSNEMFYNINVSGLSEILKRCVILYIGLLAAYLIISYSVSVYRYDRAYENVSFYVSMLKRMGRKFK